MKTELLTYTPSKELREPYPNISWKDLLPHQTYTYAIEKISRACSHQLVRHRIASFSQQSQRYITVKKLKERVVTPPSIPENSASYIELVEKASEAYQTLVEQGVPKEDARFVLPNAAMTSMLLTMDGKALFHFFGLRCCNRAQWEIRELADSMLEQVREADPVFNQAGPYCYQLGYCPEGRFTCGRMQEAVDRYKASE